MPRANGRPFSPTGAHTLSRPANHMPGTETLFLRRAKRSATHGESLKRKVI